MKFSVKDTLSEQEIESGLKALVRDGLASQAMTVLTGGVFLVGFALQMGASNFVIGLLAAIPALTQLAQIPSVYLVEKVRNRRAITVYASFISRGFLFFIATIPFLFDSSSPRLNLLIIALFLHTLFAAIGGSGWNSWMQDLVPQQRLGAFFSRRLFLATILGIALSLLAGIYIDCWKELFPGYGQYGYSAIFFLGFFAGMLGVYFIAAIPEPRMAQLDEKMRFLRMLSQPFKNTNFRNLMMFMGSWSFAVNLAAPFFTVYMLKRLELDMSFIILLMVLSQIANLIFLQTWGAFSDRFSNKSVLGVSGPLFIICILAWTFTTLPGKHALTIPLLIAIHIFLGISTAGVTLASSNIGLKLAPRGQATAYFAATGVINSLAAAVAPILGGKFVDIFAQYELSWTLRWIGPQKDVSFQALNFQHWDFFFFLAFLIGLYSIHRLAMVKEVGEVKEKIVINQLISEIRRPLRNFSTVAGLRHVIYLPFMRIAREMKKTETGAGDYKKETSTFLM